MLAERGATPCQPMSLLGHDDIAHAELYAREAEQKVLAREGTAKVSLALIAGTKCDGNPRGKPAWRTVLQVIDG